MCGRYFLIMKQGGRKAQAILAELKRRGHPMAAQVKLGEIYPGQIAPVIIREACEWTVRPMKWGFPRHGGGGLVINSRSEKADVTPMFSRALRERRCLIPVSGFFEWKRTPSGSKTKDKFAFALEDGSELMYLAGLYGRFGGGYEEGGFDGFAILTQAADEQMSPYHDRMPVILRSEDAKQLWLAAPPDTPYDLLKAGFCQPKLEICPAAERIQEDE